MVGGSWTRLEKNFRKTSSTNDDDNDVVSESILFILLYFFYFFIFASTHDDPGCQGQARRESTSTSLLPVGLWWMTPATPTPKKEKN